MQGDRYIQNEADKWFDRNKMLKHNCFTEYFLSLFSKQTLADFQVAEFGIGNSANINLLSQYVHKIDGYDGSQKAIEALLYLKERNPNIDGKRVNLAERFEPINSYDIIIFGFFTYMISDVEFQTLMSNATKMLNKGGYIFIYDYLSKESHFKKDSHNEDFNVYKRDLDFYLKYFHEFHLVDFRLFDNRYLKKYLLSDNQQNIDTDIDQDDYNWTFTSLFRLNNKPFYKE